jgi:hypothetical protein
MFPEEIILLEELDDARCIVAAVGFDRLEKLALTFTFADSSAGDRQPDGIQIPRSSTRERRWDHSLRTAREASASVTATARSMAAGGDATPAKPATERSCELIGAA